MCRHPLIAFNALCSKGTFVLRLNVTYLMSGLYVLLLQFFFLFESSSPLLD